MLSNLVTHKLFAKYSNDIVTEQSFCYMKLIEMKSLDFYKCVIMPGFVYGSPKFSPAEYFPCMVVWYMYVPTELLALPNSLKVCFKLTVMLLFVFSGHPIVKSLNNRSHDWEWLKYYLNHNLHRFLVAIDTYIKY